MTIRTFMRSAALAAAGVACGAALTVSLTAFAEKSRTVQLPVEDIRLFADVFGSVKNYYVDEISDKKLLENAVKGMVEGLDPHSTFLDAKAYADMEESTMGEFGGLGLEVTKDPSGVRVVSPIDDTPAARAGVMAGDLIIKIDDKATADLSLNENVKLMRGKPKTSIVLTIARKGSAKPIVIKLERAIIKIQSVKSKLLTDNVGYIRISQFQERTADDVALAYTKLADQAPLKGVVLDLRNNPGGLLQAAIGVSAVFLPEHSLVVSTRGRTPENEKKYLAVLRDYAVGNESPDHIAQVPESAKSVPLVVLVNPASASASEIVAGALQDHKRATIMGTRSFGKGSVQTIIPLRVKNGETTGVKFTTARYYTPSGRTIQAKGITPNIAVDDTPEGNYPSFNLRESDLAHHIEVTDGKNEDAKAAKKETDDAGEEAFDEENAKVPTLRYMFGDDKDFPLEQAKNQLLGKKVITHAETQAKLKAEAKTAKEKAAAIVNPPGYSEHNCGLAADLNSPEHTGLDEGFEKTAAFRWLCEHAGDYGFILRYPKDAEDKTEIIYEPWHWRYVGVENAAKINASGLCFEEYIETLQSIAAEG